MVVIIDYQMGNVRSVANAFTMIGCDVSITHDKNDIEAASRIVLPGVGAFGEGMNRLRKRGLVEVLQDQVLKKRKPFLGICLGMQMLATLSYEFGKHEGLGWIPGEVQRIEANDLLLPHVGWNSISMKSPCRILDRLTDETDFYFVHSYQFRATEPKHVSAVCEYGEQVSAVVSRGNIFGTQFHPEKSQKAGRILLENFMQIV